MKLTLSYKGREWQGWEIYLCLFETDRNKEIKVTATEQQLLDFRKYVDREALLDAVFYAAAEYATRNGVTEGKVDLVGKTYRAVVKKLSRG